MRDNILSWFILYSSKHLFKYTMSLNLEKNS